MREIALLFFLAITCWCDMLHACILVFTVFQLYSLIVNSVIIAMTEVGTLLWLQV